MFSTQWDDRNTRDNAILADRRSMQQQEQEINNGMLIAQSSWQKSQPSEENATRIILRQTENIDEDKESLISPYGGATNNNNNGWTFYDYWISTLVISNVLVLIVTTVLVAILFSNVKDSQMNNYNMTTTHLYASMTTKNNMFIIADTWITNAGTCKEWIDGNCARFIDQEPNPKLLEGILPNEKEKPSTGLFSSVNAPFLCLAAVVMSSAYSMCLLVVKNEYSSNDSSQADSHLTPKMLKSISLLILVTYAVLFLFIQRDWFLPFNNLLLVEFLFMISFLVINTFSVYQKHMYFGMRLLNTMFTSPLVAISVLTMIGEDNSVSLILVYVSLVVSVLLILLANNEDAAVNMNSNNNINTNNRTSLNANLFHNMRPHFPSPSTMTKKGSDFINNVGNRMHKITANNGAWVENFTSTRRQFTYSFVISFWICIVPFLVQCGLRFKYMMYESPIPYPSWSTGCLALMFALYIVDGITWSFQYGIRGYFALNVEDDTFSITSVLFKTLDLIAKYVLVLLVIIGYYIEFKSSTSS